MLSGTCCTALIYKYLTDVEEVDYGDVQYWKARYAEEWYQQPYDWLGTFASLKPWIAEAAKGSRVVHLGCGTSLLAEEMFDSGAFGEIWNVDVSDACLQAGQKTRLIGGFPLLKSSCYCPPVGSTGNLSLLNFYKHGTGWGVLEGLFALKAALWVPCES